MTDHRNRRLESQLVQAGKWHANLVIVLAIAVLASWQFDWRFLKQPIARFVSMNPLTAVLFVLASVAYILQLRTHESSRWHYVVIGSMLAVVIAAALRLVEIFWGISARRRPDTFFAKAGIRKSQ
jgi:hypothetical protein